MLPVESHRPCTTALIYLSTAQIREFGTGLKVFTTSPCQPGCRHEGQVDRKPEQPSIAKRGDSYQSPRKERNKNQSFLILSQATMPSADSRKKEAVNRKNAKIRSLFSAKMSFKIVVLERHSTSKSKEFKTKPNVVVYRTNLVSATLS